MPTGWLDPYNRFTSVVSGEHVAELERMTGRRGLETYAAIVHLGYIRLLQERKTQYFELRADRMDAARRWARSTLSPDQVETLSFSILPGGRDIEEPLDKSLMKSWNDDDVEGIVHDRGGAFSLVSPSPFLFRVKGSYFGECERDDQGHCLPSGQSGQENPEEEKKPEEDEATSRGLVALDKLSDEYPSRFEEGKTSSSSGNKRSPFPFSGIKNRQQVLHEFELAGGFKIARKQKVRKVELASLISTDPDISMAVVADYMSKPLEKKSPGTVVKFQGKLWIVDGHHRLSVAILRGERSGWVRVFDLDDKTKTIPPSPFRKNLPSYQGKSFSLTPDDPIKVHLPDLQQTRNYTCGASAMASICEFFGVGPETEIEFADLLNSDPEEGTNPQRIIDLGMSYGLGVEVRQGMTIDDLKKHLDQEHPILVLIQAWGDEADEEQNYPRYDDGHYVVVVGYDATNIYVEDPSLKGVRGTIPQKDFLERWHDEGRGKRYERWGAAFSKQHEYEPVKSLVRPSPFLYRVKDLSYLDETAGGAVVPPPKQKGGSDPQQIFDFAARIVGGDRALRLLNGPIQELHREYSRALQDFKKEEEDALGKLIALRTTAWSLGWRPKNLRGYEGKNEVRRVENNPYQIVMFSDGRVRISSGGFFQRVDERLAKIASRALGERIIPATDKNPLDGYTEEGIMRLFGGKSIEQKDSSKTSLPVIQFGRDAFLYLDPKPPKEQFAQCATCMMWTGDKHQTCTIHGKDVEITAEHSCNFYVHGEPMPDEAGQEMESVTPEESGLVLRQVRCENCLYFVDENRCELFTLLDLPDQVDPYGCCNAQTPVGIRKKNVVGFLTKGEVFLLPRLHLSQRPRKTPIRPSSPLPSAKARKTFD